MPFKSRALSLADGRRRIPRLEAQEGALLALKMKG
jgi:hypothetical protein